MPTLSRPPNDLGNICVKKTVKSFRTKRSLVSLFLFERSEFRKGLGNF